MELKDLIRNGVPHDYRAELWWIISHAKNLSVLNPEHQYPYAIARAFNEPAPKMSHYPTPDKADFTRFRPPIPWLEENRHVFLNLVALDEKQHAAFERILFVLDTEDNLVDHLAPVCEAVLVALCLDAGMPEWPAHDTAWKLVTNAVSEPRYYAASIELDPRQHKIRGMIFTDMAKKVVPKPATHITGVLNVDLASIADKWFDQFFIGVLPASLSQRVPDLLMLEGPKVFFRFGLALL